MANVKNGFTGKKPTGLFPTNPEETNGGIIHVPTTVPATAPVSGASNRPTTGPIPTDPETTYGGVVHLPTTPQATMPTAPNTTPATAPTTTPAPTPTPTIPATPITPTIPVTPTTPVPTPTTTPAAPTPTPTEPTPTPTEPTPTPTTTPTAPATTLTASPTTPTEPATPAEPGASTEGFTYGDFSYADFAPSSTVQQAEALIQQHMANQPGTWSDPYIDQWMGYLNQYENRDPFAYDFNADALYQQYKDQYIQQGQMAMMDTMGQAAAMTGGYGNSYAQSVGQQAYNQYLGKLHEVMPELYGMAYDRYQQEGQELLNMYDIYSGLSAQDYGRHQDTVDNWYRELDHLKDDYDTMYDREYDAYLEGKQTAYDEYQTDRSEALAAREYLTDLIANTGYEPTAAELAAAGMSQQQAEAIKNAYNNTTSADTAEETKHTVLDYDEQAKWTKDFEKATSLDEVDVVADRMEQAGVDPQVVASWHDYYAKKFKVETPPAGATGAAVAGAANGVGHFPIAHS